MKKSLIPFLVIGLCLIVLTIGLHLAAPAAPDAPGENLTQPTVPVVSASAEATGPAASVPAGRVLTFPLEPGQDGLIVESPFTYDGPNPDCGFTEGQSIAAITVKNTSGRHLVLADITLVLSDGTQIPFRIEHIPATKRVTAFALNNASVSADAVWTDIRISTQFAETESLRGDGVSITENGILMEVTNDTAAALDHLTIYCHNLLGDAYFGGTAYPYVINNIPSGATVTVEAQDCILGIAEAAYTEGNQE